MVKVVKGEQKQALYFSRAPIPYPRDAFAEGTTRMPDGEYFRHIGLYAYRAHALKAIPDLQISPLENLEMLEQLRPLSSGMNILVDEAWVVPAHGVDTESDLQRVRLLMGASGNK